MKQVYSFYNNELLTGLAVLSVLKKNGKLKISKALLIQPLLSYIGLLQFIRNKKTKIRSIEELIVKKNIAFTNFNKRYFENLELSINSILLFKQLGLMKIDGNTLVYIENCFDFSEKMLGSRAREIIIASHNIADILKKEDASNLYLSLRIEL